MIDYETYCKIREYRDRENMKQAQIAQALVLRLTLIQEF